MLARFSCDWTGFCELALAEADKLEIGTRSSLIWGLESALRVGYRDGMGYLLGEGQELQDAEN